MSGTLLGPSKYFPPPSRADSDGLVAIGGLLEPDWLLDAYSHGIFPWPVFDDPDVMAWWSPDPRAVLEFDQLYVSHRLARRMRSGQFRVTIDQDFSGVISGCATAQQREGNTWISPEMIDAYTQMHELGHAHSVEVWQDNGLAGGLYGIAIGGLFAGESMFYRARDASKVALAALVAHLKCRGYGLFDLQQLNPHTIRMGGTEIPRDQYLHRLAEAVALRVTFGEELSSN